MQKLFAVTRKISLTRIDLLKSETKIAKEFHEQSSTLLTPSNQERFLSFSASLESIIPIREEYVCFPLIS